MIYEKPEYFYVSSYHSFGPIILLAILALAVFIFIKRKSLKGGRLNLLIVLLVALTSFSIGWFGHEYGDHRKSNNYLKSASFNCIDC